MDEIAQDHAAAQAKAQAAAEARARRAELAARSTGPARRSARAGVQATNQRISEHVRHLAAQVPALAFVASQLLPHHSAPPDGAAFRQWTWTWHQRALVTRMTRMTRRAHLRSWQLTSQTVCFALMLGRPHRLRQRASLGVGPYLHSLLLLPLLRRLLMLHVLLLTQCCCRR